jgi:hypothetical protein
MFVSSKPAGLAHGEMIGPNAASAPAATQDVHSNSTSFSNAGSSIRSFLPPRSERSRSSELFYLMENESDPFTRRRPSCDLENAIPDVP